MISLASVATVSTIVGGAATTWVGVKRITQKNERLRHRIGEDLALRDKLPEHSVGRGTLELHIDESVEVLVQIQRAQMSARTDPYGAIWGAIFFAFSIGLGAWAYQSEYHVAIKVAMWLGAGFLLLLTAIAVVAARKDDAEDEARKLDS